MGLANPSQETIQQLQNQIKKYGISYIHVENVLRHKYKSILEYKESVPFITAPK